MIHEDIFDGSTWWNYRLVRHDGLIDLFEVYYRGQKPVARTANPATFGTDDDDPSVVVKMLRNALKDAADLPVLDDSIFGVV